MQFIGVIIIPWVGEGNTDLDSSFFLTQNLIIKSYRYTKRENHMTKIEEKIKRT